jgi:SpoIID/LytB domain protein
MRKILIYFFGLLLSGCHVGEELKVRVGIVEDKEMVEIMGDEAICMVWSQQKAFGKGPYQFKVEGAKKAKLLYIPIVATIKASNETLLHKTVEGWKGKGYDVLVKMVGQKMKFKNLELDIRDYWVGIARFSKKKEAEEFRDRLYEKGTPTWILEELKRPPQGKILILEGEKLLHRALPPVKLSSPSLIMVDGIPYEGTIEIHINNHGRICVVDELGLEGYIKGIVPREISPTSPYEALKAQAVVARSETLSKIGKRHTSSPYHFCASEHCQVYSGLERKTPLTDQAVEDTYGEVLLFREEVVDSVYCGNCGGHTEDNENIWTSEPYPFLRGIRDYKGKEEGSVKDIESWIMNPPPSYCDYQEGKFRWRRTYTQEELSELINKVKKIGKVKDIILGERGVSGRLKWVEVIGEGGSFKIRKEYWIRKAFGGLQSGAFILRIKRGEDGWPVRFSFIGAGWGHGVGMCQAGCIGMARQGKSYREILRHYYSGIKVRRIYRW